MLKKMIPFTKRSRFEKIKRKIKGKTIFRDYFDEHQCVFVHVPKVAGTSMKNTLFPGGGGPGHKPAMEYFLDNPDKFQRYFVFAFVRNPYDRLVSAYNYLMQGGKGGEDDRNFRDTYLVEYKDFTDFVKRGLRKSEIITYWHLVPQYLYLVNYDGEVIVDFIGSFENINEDFNKVAKRLNMDVELPHKNKSVRNDYRSYYTEETQKIAYEVYKRDFELFGYPEEL